MSTVLAGILVLGLLVFIHELGHFLAAKYFRVRVEVFSLGFGPRLVGFTKGETDYRLAPIPLGGYVRMSGELPGEHAAGGDDPGMLSAKPRWQRLVIMAAGPAMNILLAIGLWWGLYVHGIEALDIPAGPPRIEALQVDSPGARAGLLAGDRILRIDERAIDSVDDYQDAILLRPGQRAIYRVERDGQPLNVPVELGKHPQFGVGWDGVRIQLPLLISDVFADTAAARAGILPGDRIVAVNGRVPSGPDAFVVAVKSGESPQVELDLLRDGAELKLLVTPQVGEDGRPRLGVNVGYARKVVSYPVGEALAESLRTAGRNTTILFTTLGKLLRRELGLEVMSGPLEIARISRDQIERGAGPFLLLLAFISFQLGLFNLLPIPVLDGGHILILMFEGALRRDLSVRFKERVLQVGVVLLICFAVVVIYLDTRKLRAAQLERDEPVVTQPAAP